MMKDWVFVLLSTAATAIRAAESVATFSSMRSPALTPSFGLPDSQWRPVTPQEYGEIKWDPEIERRRDRKAGSATAAEAWADKNAGGVIPSVPTGPTGGSADVAIADNNDILLYVLGKKGQTSAAKATVRALEMHPEVFSKGHALRGQGSLTTIVQSIYDLDHLESRAENVGSHMADKRYPSVLAGDEPFIAHATTAVERRNEDADSKRHPNKEHIEDEVTASVPESLQRVLRPEATGTSASRERRLKRVSDSVAWRLRYDSKRQFEAGS